MSDEQNNQQAAQAAPVSVNGQYIKDLSFEVPGAPQIFTELNKGAPEIPINVDIRAQPLGQNLYEVALHFNIESKVQGKTVFIVELAYAGVFTLNVPQEHLQPMLLIECPRLIFPFARNIIADITREGGFPPLMMQPIDFLALFRQRVEQAQAEAAAAEGQPGNGAGA